MLTKEQLDEYRNCTWDNPSRYAVSQAITRLCDEVERLQREIDELHRQFYDEMDGND